MCLTEISVTCNICFMDSGILVHSFGSTTVQCPSACKKYNKVIEAELRNEGEFHRKGLRINIPLHPGTEWHISRM